MEERVTVLVHCTPLQWDLSMYEVSSWYLKDFLSYAPDKIYAFKATEGNN